MKRHSVLIVDDNAIDLMVHSRALKRSGRFDTVDTAQSGKEALALLQDHAANRLQDPEQFPVLLMLLDINMPVMNGFDFLERLKEIGLTDDPRFIVMLTSSSADTDRQKALSNARVADYLVKPFSTTDAHAIADKLDSWEDSPPGS
ncbi:response regulator [Granulosicoccus sp. 3-233]|uniref:response regulator n=1 Tax=Granulosicoccus sp. 3-233 TaxID=3417969 RepID=UPI003D33BA23